MKRIGPVLMMAALLFGLAACKAAQPSDQTPLPPDSAIPQAAPEQEEDAVPSGALDENPGGMSAGEESPRVLVACFFATGNTRPLAEAIADSLGADFYEIVPETPCSEADLDYGTDCRANREQNDDTARPAITGEVEHMEDYDVVFLGYPIWWGKAPKIIHTFLESYKWEGKTIVPFCTSGSSAYNDSTISSLAEGAAWITGSRFPAGTSRSTVESWINGLELPRKMLNERIMEESK